MNEAAAIFRVEGTLLPRDVVATSAAWIAGHNPLVGDGILRRGAALGALPLGRAHPELGARLAWLACRGLSSDRIAVLAQLRAKALELDPTGLRLVDEARRRGMRVVWVTGLIEDIARPLAARVGVDELICDRLELRRDRATGKLETPIALSFLGGPALAEFAARRGLDLQRSAAYGASPEDQTLLASVGLPCALRPSVRLRHAATTLTWPVVES